MTACKPTSFRLSDDALEVLAMLSARHSLTRSETIEWLLTGIIRKRQRQYRRRAAIRRNRHSGIRDAVLIARTAYALQTSATDADRPLVRELIKRALRVMGTVIEVRTPGPRTQTDDTALSVSPAPLPDARFLALLLNGEDNDHS